MSKLFERLALLAFLAVPVTGLVTGCDSSTETTVVEEGDTIPEMTDEEYDAETGGDAEDEAQN